MLPEECNSCFEEIMNKTTEFLESQKDSHKEALSELTKNHNDYLEKKDKRETRSTAVVIAALGLFTLVIGYMFERQVTFQKEIELKANKNEVLRIDDAKTIRELGDRYYDARYIIRDGAEPDPINYKMFVETLFERASRGGDIAK